MELPRVKILFENGALGSTVPSEDGVVGLITHGEEVAGKFQLEKPYLVTKLSMLEDLGITSKSTGVNANIYKIVEDFYTEATSGSKLWIMAFVSTTLMKDMLVDEKAGKLIDAASGSINVLMVSKTGVTKLNSVGIDGDVIDSITPAQALAEAKTDSKFAPYFTILEGKHYTGVVTDLANLHTREDNRVAILIGDTKKDSDSAAIGLLAGRIAAIPVQRSIARVKSGAIGVDELYIKDKTPENASPEIIHEKGFITFRTFVGKAGYYFSDDKLATAISDDYALIPRRRTIDKAYRIAYQTLVNELNDEIPVTDKNTIPAPIVKSIQNKVEAAIERSMTAYGNLGNDSSNPNDTGVVCYINPDQDVVSGSTLNIVLQVKPYGYAKYINVNLGFKTTTV